jgi:hypothetical protein
MRDARYFSGLTIRVLKFKLPCVLSDERPGMTEISEMKTWGVV